MALLSIFPRPLELQCDECPAVIADDDVDAVTTDAKGLIVRVVCARCRVRLGALEWAPQPAERAS